MWSTVDAYVNKFGLGNSSYGLFFGKLLDFDGKEIPDQPAGTVAEDGTIWGKRALFEDSPVEEETSESVYSKMMKKDLKALLKTRGIPHPKKRSGRLKNAQYIELLLAADKEAEGSDSDGRDSDDESLDSFEGDDTDGHDGSDSDRQVRDEEVHPGKGEMDEIRREDTNIKSPCRHAARSLRRSSMGQRSRNSSRGCDPLRTSDQ
jgi:hypothetical protein